MLEMIRAGGWVMIPILLCAVAALAITVERFWTLRQQEVIPPGLGKEVREWATGRNIEPKHIEVLRRNSPLGELLAAGLDVRHKPRDVIKERIEDVGRHVIHRLERFLPSLGTIASVAPLLGLLGTVIGMIKMFLDILVTGVGDANQLAGGIGQALITTAAGLCVAIPALIAHRYLRSKVNDLVIEMEQQAMQLVDALDESTSSKPKPGKRSEG